MNQGYFLIPTTNFNVILLFKFKFFSIVPKDFLNNNILLFLTGTINTYNKEFCVLNDPEKRKNEYINTIRYYLANYGYRILFVENSNENISSQFEVEIENKQLEILCFDGNKYDEKIGKGLGEMLCIEYGILHSSFIRQNPFIFKITGRYKILNLKNFIDFYKTHSDTELIADLTNNFKSSQSCIFGFKPFFAKKFLLNYTSILNDTSGIYFEHALAKAVLLAISENIKFYIFRYYPKIHAISGTTGKAYNISFFYFSLRRLKYFIRYYIMIR